ncbi:MAG TPA: TolC family protein [Verrucomicrobiae bacterium]|nr:TolC family protein [Verrucomicrobiae bacterium]
MKRTFALLLVALAVCSVRSYAADDDPDALLKALEEIPTAPATQEPAPAPGPAVTTASDTDPLQALTMLHKEVVQTPIEVATQDDLTRASIRDRVRTQREERAEKMPYLSRGIIKDSIDAKRVHSRSEFISGDEKKLQEIVDRAVETNLPAKAAWERIALAKRRIFGAVRELFPGMHIEYKDEQGFQSDQKFNSRGYHVELRQPIFRGGVLWNTLLQERAELKSAQKEYDKIIEDMVRDVSEAYFEYNRASEVVKDQQDAILKMEPFAKISEQKFKEELISEIEHLNVQSLYNQMQYDFETSKQELELAKLDMQSYLDLEIEDSIEVSPLYDMDTLLASGRQDSKGSNKPEEAPTEFADGKPAPELPALVDLAYHNRAELQVEAYKLESSRLNERVKTGALLPRADIVLEMGALGEAFDADATNPKKRNEFRCFLEFKWNALGSTIGHKFENDENAPSVTQFQSSSGTQTTSNTLSVDLFDGLDALVQMKEAEADKLDQIVELEKAEKEVIQDVKQAYYDYQKALIQVKSSLQKLDYRERLARLSKHRLEQNEIQISEYFQAELDLQQERTELNKALKDYFTAKAALNRAVGIRNYLPIEETYVQ